MKVVQNDGKGAKFGKNGNMAIKIIGLVVYNVAGAEVYLRTKLYLDPSSRLATIHGQKSGGRAVPPFLGVRAVSPSNTMSPAQRSTSVPSVILIHPAVWPQYMGRKVVGGLCRPFWG